MSRLDHLLEDEDTPPAVSVKRVGSGRSYAINGTDVPGATTVLSNGYPKGGLPYWSADSTAWTAIHDPEWRNMDERAAYDYLRRSPWKQRDRAAKLGTDVHRWAEQLAAGNQVDIPADQAGYVDAVLAFLRDHNVVVTASERSVFSPRWQYAGTFDLVADSRHGRGLFDYKSGKDVYPDVALQLSAYRYAKWMQDDTGAVVLNPANAVDYCAVVWLRDDGRYEVVPVSVDLNTFATFLYVREVAKFTTLDRNAIIGEALV